MQTNNFEKDSLESKVEKSYEPARDIKAYLVDTSARILFYVPIIAVWEKYVAGMEDYKVLKSRASAVAANFFLGRYHGKIREFASRITKTDENSSETRKTIVDTGTGLFVGITSYASMLGIAGATLKQALVAMPFVLGLTISTS